VVFLRQKIVYDLYIMSKSSGNPIPFDRPVSYKIIVQGMVDLHWSTLLDGMTMSVIKAEGKPTVTSMEGVLSDQAALAGVLNTLYELHLPVLAVICQSYSPESDQKELSGDKPSEETIVDNQDKENTT
jgi:hypothetical protein